MIVQILIGALAGAGFGFVWHKLAGCSTGACPLSANPFAATLYGMIVGALIAGSFHQTQNQHTP